MEMNNAQFICECKMHCKNLYTSRIFGNEIKLLDVPIQLYC